MQHCLELHKGNLPLIHPQAMGAQAHSSQQEPTWQSQELASKPPKAAEAHHILQQHIPRRCPQYPYTNYTMPLEYYHNTQLLFTVDPLYRQLTTASPSTLLDIKKLQKHDANLLKKARLLSKNTTPPAGAPFFYIALLPESGWAEKDVFSFLEYKNIALLPESGGAENNFFSFWQIVTNVCHWTLLCNTALSYTRGIYP